MRVKVTLLLLMVLLANREALAKCGNRIIHIEGSLVGVSGEDLRIAVQVTPDPNWQPQPEVRIDHGDFAGMVLFDRTKSEGRVRDDCVRVPDTIQVTLFRNDQELSLVRLAIAKDFVVNKSGDYKLRSPILMRPR